jgi:two-component system phosphate regulon sensor histidine kinase PhoR
MRSATLKWIILLSTFIIGLLLALQLFWLNKIYNYEQKEFSSSVVKSIQGVYEDLLLSDSSSPQQLQKLIEQPSVNSFLFRIDSFPGKDILAEDLLDNLEAFGVFADCRVALYDPSAQKFRYEFYLPGAATRHPDNPGSGTPLYKKGYAYVELFFPHRSQYILNSMAWWIISAIILLVVLIAFGVSLFFLYRQKFLNEIQNDFIRNVTHEFQTPLTTLTVGLDAIAKDSITDQPEKLARYTKLMQGQTTYLKQHIENLMKVLKADTNGVIIEKESVMPNELVQDVVAQLFPAIDESGASIELVLDASGATVLGDKNSLYMAILNLVSNAIKFSKDPLITIRTKAEHGSYTISVKDNGIGIEEVYIKKLFKKFYRVPTGDLHNVKGLGLGLYFVKKVTDAHKGTIIVKSIPGIGTEFIIKLKQHLA